MPDFRDFLPPPPWEWPPQKKRSGSISKEEFYRHIAEKYRVYIPEGVVRITEPIKTISTVLVVASFNVKQPATRRSGLAMYATAEEEAKDAISAGVIDEVAGRYIRQQFVEARELLGRLEFRRASELMDELSVNLDLLATSWMASRAEKLA